MSDLRIKPNKDKGDLPKKTDKEIIVDIKGVVIDADDWDNTTVHINRNGEWCEIPFDKDDIVETKEEERNDYERRTIKKFKKGR